MTRLRAFSLGVCLAAFLASPAVGWEWPVPVPTVERTFGTRVDGTILRGVELGGGAQPVFAVNDGVVVYVHQDGGQFDHPFGSFVVVEHDQAFRSIYAHLSSDSLPPVGRAVNSETQIGVAGDSGSVRQRVLRLYVFDSRNQAYVNPMLLLPNTPDSALPFIGTVFATGETGSYNLDAVSTVPPGTYRLSAEISDAVGSRGARGVAAPYSIALFVDGQQRFVMRADGLSIDDGEVRVSPHGNGTEMYGAQGGWVIGTIEVPTAPMTVELVVLDFAGNQRVRTVRIEGGAADEDVQ